MAPHAREQSNSHENEAWEAAPRKARTEYSFRTVQNCGKIAPTSAPVLRPIATACAVASPGRSDQSPRSRQLPVAEPARPGDRPARPPRLRPQGSPLGCMPADPRPVGIGALLSPGERQLYNIIHPSKNPADGVNASTRAPGSPSPVPSDAQSLATLRLSPAGPGACTSLAQCHSRPRCA